MCKNVKNIFSFLVVLLAIFSYSVVASAEMESQEKILDYLSEEKLELIDFSDVELVPLLEVTTYSRDVRLKRIDIGNGSIKTMNTYQMGRFLSANRYADAHEFKIEALRGVPGAGSIARYNIYYHQNTREVFVINGQNMGVSTGYSFNF